MGKTYKATIAFGNKWAQADQKISDALEVGRRIPFYIHELSSTLKNALDAVKIDDVMGEIVPRWKKPEPIKVKDFSPDALQGYHGIALEKALKTRYQKEFMKNSKEVYSRASTSVAEISEYEKGFPQALQFE